MHNPFVGRIRTAQRKEAKLEEQKKMAEVTNKITTDAASTAQQASTNSQNKKKAPGLTFKRLNTKAGVSPYDRLGPRAAVPSPD